MRSYSSKLTESCFSACDDRLRRVDAGVHRVVDALQRRHVDHAGGVAGDHHARDRQPLRHRPVAARGDRLRAPGDPLAAVEDLLHERVGLQLLQGVVAGEGRVGRVEPDHQPDADLVGAHRVDEAAAELVPLGALAQRPAHRVDHAVERLLHLPDLLDADLPAPRVGPVQVEVVQGRVGQVPQRALGQHRRLGDHVRARLEVGKLLAVAAAALVARADTAHDPVLDQELVGRGLAEHVGALLLGLLLQEAAELGDRGHVVAVVAEVRRHRLQRQRRALRQQVDRVLRHLLEDGPVRLVQVGEQLLHRRGAHVRPGQQVRARGLALLDHRDRDLAQLLGQLGLALQQLPELDRAGEAGGAAPDDRHPDLDPLLLGIGDRGDELLRRIDRRRVLRGRDLHAHGRLSRPSWP